MSPNHMQVLTTVAPSSIWDEYALTGHLGIGEDSGIASSIDFNIDVVEQLHFNEWTNLADQGDEL